METILSHINEVFAKVLNKPALTIKTTDTPESITGWDSITHTEILAEIEEKLNIEFTFKELATIKSIQDIITLVEQKLIS
jgi:acyl carrier protein